MKRVWAVSSGEYSDYGVVAIFATEEQANAFAAVVGSHGWRSGAFVEAMNFYPEGETPRAVEVFTRRGRVVNGEVEYDDTTIDTQWECDMLWGDPKPLYGARTYCPPIDKGVGVRIEARGTDRRKVDKAFTDRIMQAKAQS